MTLSRNRLLTTALAVAALAATGMQGAHAATGPEPAPGHYQPQMVHALAQSLGVSDTAAVRHLDRQADQQETLDHLERAGVRADGAFFDDAGRLVVNAADGRAAGAVRTPASRRAYLSAARPRSTGSRPRSTRRPPCRCPRA
ncbi:hypothetical protein [Streptomyces kanasensis]